MRSCCCCCSHQLSQLPGVAEGEGHFRLDVGGPFLAGDHVVEQVDQHVVVLQQRDATVSVVKGHVCLDGANVGVNLPRVTWQLGLKSHEIKLFISSLSG